MISVRLQADTRNVEALFRHLPKNMQDGVGNAMYKYAEIVRDSLRRNLLTDSRRPITSSRREAAHLIKAKKISKFRSEVRMPMKLHFLDTMTPHFVALKRGRNVTRWARKHYGSPKVVVGKRSKVMYGRREGILHEAQGFKSQLYVTGHPFVNKGLRGVRKRLKNVLGEGMRKAVKKSKR